MPQSGAIVGAVRAGSQPSEVLPTPDGRRLFVSMRGEGTVKVFDLATAQLAGSVAVGTQPETMILTPDQRTLVVTLRGSPAALALVNVETMTFIGTVPLAGAGTFGDLAVASPDRQRIYATFDAGVTGIGGVVVLDARTGQRVGSWTYPGAGRPARHHVFDSSDHVAVTGSSTHAVAGRWLLEERLPVQYDSDRLDCASSAAHVDEKALSVRSDDVLILCNASMKQFARRSGRESGAAGGDVNGHQFTFGCEIEEFLSITPPSRPGAAARRHLPFPVGLRESSNVHFVRAGLVGRVSDPAGIGRELALGFRWPPLPGTAGPSLKATLARLRGRSDRDGESHRGETVRRTTSR